MKNKHVFCLGATRLSGRVEINITSVFFQLAKDAELFEFLVRANNTSEWIWALFSEYFSFSFVGLAFVSTASVLLCKIRHGNYDVKYFFYFFYNV